MSSIQMYGGGSISTINSKGQSLGGWTWDSVNGVLDHGDFAWCFTPEATARINAAQRTVRPAVTDYKTGGELSEADREGYEFSHIHNEAHGMYVRVIPGHTAEVEFDASDIAQIRRAANA